MTSVKIYGAGSIGNHLAQASRRANWKVDIVDVDPEALARMENDIYPSRYGEWDSAINLYNSANAPQREYDVIFVGTPPDVRLAVALDALKENPKVLQLEKPFFVPTMNDRLQGEQNYFLQRADQSTTHVIVGYDHALSVNARKIAAFIADKVLGDVRIIEVTKREEWSGIFKAHPWLAGPEESYLGFWERGGGATGEHSHAIHLWQHFASLLGVGTIAHVSASMSMVDDGTLNYDAASFMTVMTDQGFIGRVVQDVVTDPAEHTVFIQRERGFVKLWRRTVVGKGTVETITCGVKSSGAWETTKEDLVVPRPDDFFEEILHIARLLEGHTDIKDSPVRLETGTLTNKVVTEAHYSRQKNSVMVPISQ